MDRLLESVGHDLRDQAANIFVPVVPISETGELVSENPDAFSIARAQVC